MHLAIDNFQWLICHKTQQKILFCIRLLCVSSVYSSLVSRCSTVQANAAIPELNVKTVLFQIIQFSMSTQYKCQNSSVLNNSV